MREDTINILTTRPLTQVLLDNAQEAGVQIDTISFIETKSSINQSVADTIKRYIPQDISVAFTSINAVEAVIEYLEYKDIVPDWMVYSLGGVTGATLKNFFPEEDVVAEAHNATQLAMRILEDNVKEVVFFCGNQRRDEMPGLLKSNQVAVTEIKVYDTIETPVKVEKTYNGILFFSPSAVRSFFSINRIDINTTLFAIGATTAEALRLFSTNKILVSNVPNKEKLAEQAIAFLKRN